MRRCACCQDEWDDILWQPFGPAATPTERSAFTWPGDHTRGFPALPLCETCQILLQDGTRLHFRYKGTWWHCEGTTLIKEEPPPPTSAGRRPAPRPARGRRGTREKGTDDG